MRRELLDLIVGVSTFLKIRADLEEGAGREEILEMVNKLERGVKLLDKLIPPA